MRRWILFWLPVLAACAPPPPPMTELSLQISIEGALEVRKPVRLRARITNSGLHDGAGVLNLEHSDTNLRYPQYHIRWVEPEGRQYLTFPRPLCGNSADLRPADVIALRPGESFDPFGPSSHPHYWIEVTPRVAGRHRAILTVDYSEMDPRRWMRSPLDTSADSEPARKLLERVPRVNLTAEAHFDVK